MLGVGEGKGRKYSPPSISMDAEPANTEGPLYYTISQNGLEHLRILVFAGVGGCVLEPILCEYLGTTVLWTLCVTF